MDLSPYILDSHYSQKNQAGASWSGTWEDVGGYRFLFLLLFPRDTV